MDFGAVFEIIAATIAAVGLICFVHYASDMFFLPEEIALTVEILDDDARRDADILLAVLDRSTWKRLGGEVRILVAEKYANDDELAHMIESVGGVRYIAYK